MTITRLLNIKSHCVTDSLPFDFVMSNIGAKTLIKCNVALTDFVSLNTALLSNVLWSEGIISTELQREVLEQQYSSASKVVSCLIDRVEVNEEDFFVLLRILGSIDCSEDIVGIIQKEYCE